MDCDAFYASVEKRDNPDLASKPVIIGGGRRGVVSTACYVARVRGVKSAMPMFQALKLCPEAVVVRPRMDEYVKASAAIRKMMQELTPAIEPLSLDEAFLDMTGTTALHGAPPAVMLARLVKRMKGGLRPDRLRSVCRIINFSRKSPAISTSQGDFLSLERQETHQFLKDKPDRSDLGRGVCGTGRIGTGGHPHICRSFALGTARPKRALRIDG
jgi:DNA polymerase-4